MSSTLPRGARDFLNTFTEGLRPEDLERLFTRETPDAYRFFLKGFDQQALAKLGRVRRSVAILKLSFLAFTLRLSPARRAIYGMGVAAALIGVFQLWHGFRVVVVLPQPVFSDGTVWLLTGFLLTNLIVVLEVADRLSLKHDLEIAREIQQAMLPKGTFLAPGVEAFGLTRPANTVGGDCYDILPLPDGRVLVALGDVAGKGSPAALLMALLLAMMRTLVDEGFEATALMARLNAQVVRHAPSSRFITLFLAWFDPSSGRVVYVNAGQTPPLVRRADGSLERLHDGGIALGMFESATYAAGETRLAAGDVLVMYSDGITEAENRAGVPFDEAGIEAILRARPFAAAQDVGRALFAAVDAHVTDARLLDDLTVLVVRPLPPAPTVPAAAQAALA